MPSLNPFSESVFRGEWGAAPESIDLYPEAKARLLEAIASAVESPRNGQGRVVMLRSASSGTGKSHLIAQVAAESMAMAHLLPLQFDRESRPNWKCTLQQLLDRLAEPVSGAPCTLSLAARQLLAELLGALIENGVIPSELPARARRGLELNYASMLDLRADSALAEWFRENSNGLRAPLAEALRRHTKFGHAASREWINFFIRLETGTGEIQIPSRFVTSEAEAKARVGELGQIVTRHRPLVLVLDHLDAFFNDRDSALGTAYLVAELARIRAAKLIVVACNDDLWRGTFELAAPDALIDRLAESPIELAGLDHPRARALLQARLQRSMAAEEHKQKFFQSLDLGGLLRARASAPLTAREVLRAASAAWESGGAESSGGAPLVEPARETLGRIRDILHGVNQRRDSPPQAEQASVTTQDDEPDSPWAEPPADAPPTLHRFAEEREEFYFGDDLTFDLAAIRDALELAGRRSPLIDYREFDVAEGVEAACWRSPDHEILFGFEPAERTPYWRALLEQASESPVGRAKVVAFTPPGAADFQSEGINGIAHETLDVLELDRCALASIAAAGRLMAAAEDREETFAQIAPELEFLWRRITRPMEEEARAS